MGLDSRVTKTFYDWCIEYERMDLNDRFDEEKNGCTSKDVAYKSNEKWWFKCHRGIHGSELRTMSVVTSDPKIKLLCKQCNSLAQVVIDKFGEEYLLNHWHGSNVLNPWDISYGNDNIKVNIQCQEKDYHVYSQIPLSFSKGIGCPYCKGRLVHPKDSLAALRPDMIDRWSNKNDKSPYEYTIQSGKKVWFTCPIGKHDDYKQSISDAAKYQYRCPKCSLDETSARMSGSNNYFWKGGINGENDNFRHRREYKNWRTSIYERDNYICQCCGTRGGKLNAHHINSFSDYEELRYNINNGITLCENCHDSSKRGSFHNLYGTHNNTPSQLRQYILDKSNKDIYITNPTLLYHTQLLSSNEF